MCNVEFFPFVGLSESLLAICDELRQCDSEERIGQVQVRVIVCFMAIGVGGAADCCGNHFALVIVFSLLALKCSSSAFFSS